MVTQLTIPTLSTPRLRLRAPEMRDLDAYAAFRGDPVRSKVFGGPYSREQAFVQLGALIGHWQLRGFGRFLVADIDTDEALGVVGPHHPTDWPGPEIAWSVFANAEGQGIAYEAVVAARQYAYETLGWTTAISLIGEDNARSIALAKRLGCTREPDFVHPDIGPLGCWRHPPVHDTATAHRLAAQRAGT
ncbi:MAG: GNAT family N-acetyltransferase [Pseudomonadota bacterium]